MTEENRFIYCSKCGKKSSKDAKFCTNCGNKLTTIEDSIKNTTENIKDVLGLIVIILAYIVILYYKKYNIPFPSAIFATVIMVIIGTMLLFKGFFTFIVSKLINNKDFLYKGTNILVITI